VTFDYTEGRRVVMRRMFVLLLWSVLALFAATPRTVMACPN